MKEKGQWQKRVVMLTNSALFGALATSLVLALSLLTGARLPLSAAVACGAVIGSVVSYLVLQFRR